MYKVIGKHGCGRCEIVKGILTEREIQFEYCYMEDSTAEEQTLYLALAQEYRVNNFPMIIKDNKVIALEEVN